MFQENVMNFTIQPFRRSLLAATILGVATLGFTAMGLAAEARAQPASPPSGGGNAQSSLIAHGQYLARMGDCVACHTAVGGKAFAGGLQMDTPFGQIFSPNITPDKDTGIGGWSDDQFYNALHKGIDNHGDNLYPAMPYPWFTHVTRDDVMAIKAYLFSQQPVHAPRKPNQMIFPFNVRAGIVGWNALYFKEGTFQPDTGKSPQWNRGAYIVTGLAHCAACHTPRNAAQAPIEDEAFAGGRVNNWFAPNITPDPQQGIGSWSEDKIATFLKQGALQGKGVAFGPMAQTVHESLSHLTDEDLHDIAIYLKSLPPKKTYQENTAQSTYVRVAGAQVYDTNCSSCHQPDGRGLGKAVPPLAGNGIVKGQQPDDIVHAVLGGLPAQDTYGPMPGFASVLNPEQVAAVANYIRTSWGNNAPANATPDLVARLIPKSTTMMSATEPCKDPGNDPLGRKLNAPSAGITDALHKVNETTLLPEVKKIVADARRVAPGAPQADVVNQLTAAYCPIVFSDKSVKPALRAPRLDQFAILVYSELSQPNLKE
jgi:mono/diheme cytochrome c family protein